MEREIARWKHIENIGKEKKTPLGERPAVQSVSAFLVFCVSFLKKHFFVFSQKINTCTNRVF